MPWFHKKKMPKGRWKSNRFLITSSHVTHSRIINMWVSICVNVTIMAFTKFILSFSIHPTNILLTLSYYLIFIFWGSLGWKQQFLSSIIEQGKKHTTSMCNEKGETKKESRWTLKMVGRNCVWESIRSQYLFQVYWR